MKTKLLIFSAMFCLLAMLVFTGVFDFGGAVGVAMATAPIVVPESAPSEIAAALKKILGGGDESKVVFTDAQLEGLEKIIDAKTKSVKAGFGAPNIVKTVGDPKDVNRAYKMYLTGDMDVSRYNSVLKENGQSVQTFDDEVKMNIGTSSAGGAAVPVGHYQGIIAKKAELAIASKLGVTQIPGQGTTVNVPVEAGSANQLDATAEAANYGVNDPQLGLVPMTLGKFTRRLELTDELLQDEDSALMAFIENKMGRVFALTENSLLLTEVLANGSALLTTASATVATATEIKSIPYKVPDGYADVAMKWVMRRGTEGTIRGFQGTDFLFDNTPSGTSQDRILAGYPVLHSEGVAAYGATGNKFAAFGDWSCVGQRTAPQITVIRDPYSGASAGKLYLHYVLRTVFKTLDASGVGYVKHA